MTLRAIVLGSAAGGGFPQWNSAGSGCLRARSGDPAARPRTQTSLAVTADGARWLLVNAAPDIRAQIEATPALHPRPPAGGIRHSPIAAVLPTGAEIDTIAGLLTLRERHAFVLLGTLETLAVLAGNPVFNVLDPARVPRVPLPHGPFQPADGHGRPLGLTLEAFVVPGKPALFLEGTDGAPESTIGLAVSADDGPALLFIPGCARLTPALEARLRGAACVLFDGTLWQDDELARAGAGTRSGRAMGHMSLSGPGGTLAAFRDLGVRRKVLVHLNNTNPVLLDDSPERAQVTAAGWEVAWDGMEITL